MIHGIYCFQSIYRLLPGTFNGGTLRAYWTKCELDNSLCESTMEDLMNVSSATELRQQRISRESLPVVRFEGISKYFGSVLACNDVSLDVLPGTIHAVLGENGAGKSTLMKMLAGILKPDSGRIWINGSSTAIQSPRHAGRLGIGMVHQHFSVIPALTVAENLVLDCPNPSWRANGKETISALLEEANKYGIALEPERPVWQLSFGKRQFLEVFRLLLQKSSVLILDEPTSVLSPIEGDRLLEQVSLLSREGHTVLLVTHKLHEIERFADRVTILRRGTSVATLEVSQTNPAELSKLMVGDSHIEHAPYHNQSFSNPSSTPEIVHAENLCQRGPRGNNVLEGINFCLRSNSILGVAGISGNGQEELAQLIAGLQYPSEGRILWRKSGKLAIGYIPADRLSVGAPVELSVAENLVLRDFWDEPIAKHGIVNRRRLLQIASARSDGFGIISEGLHVPTSHLSGGNILRVILARELSRKLDVLIAHNPTAGLDVHGIGFVRKKIWDAARQGAAVLLISDDLDELLQLSDEIMVLYKGCSMGVFKRDSMDRMKVGKLMIGSKATEE